MGWPRTVSSVPCELMDASMSRSRAFSISTLGRDGIWRRGRCLVAFRRTRLQKIEDSPRHPRHPGHPGHHRSGSRMKSLVYSLAVACVLFGSILLAFFLGGLSRAPSSRPAMSGNEPGIRASPRAGLEEEQPASVPSTKKERGKEADKTAQGEAAEPPAAVSQGPLPIPRGKSQLIFEVTDSSSQPLAGVVVTLLSGRAARDVTSGVDGTAPFSNIKEDTYSYRVRGEGFPELVSAREVALSFGEHKRIRLKLGAFNLSISGRVLDRSGRPVPGVVVYARKQALTAGEADLLPFDSDDLKGESRLDGAYDISGLEAGDYLLSTESQS